MTKDKDCKHCGACYCCDRCAHCGHCRKCGRCLEALPYRPAFPIYPAPYPIYPNTTDPFDYPSWRLFCDGTTADIGSMLTDSSGAPSLMFTGTY
ncbi:MAG TPA: hypothetical protein VMW24_03775 [Sedimentisphaerales bacterium]|nr:hypothetical protein [Sedimentisphaerales bacterium]